MTSETATRLLTSLALGLLCGGTERDGRAQADAGGRRVARVTRIGAEEAPDVDGLLVEPVWQRAQPIGPLTQVEPIQGAPASEATDVRFLATSSTLYMAIRCFDADPGSIRATQPGRDAGLDPDARVEFFFDTFHDRRNAYWFQIGAAGSRGDALISRNGDRFNKDFDTIWEGRTRITPEGWQAEIAVPFRSLALDPESTTWGFNLRRFIRRKNESVRWASPFQRIRFFRVSEAGVLEGLGDVEAGLGLDVKPGFVTRYVDTRMPRDRDRRGEPTLDLSYRITPNLTTTLTFNTDFAETEVDSRQINLTRFPLFFPERRDFFLEDSSIFEFGERSSTILPFFSRRIGLGPGGRPIPLHAGLKLAGRVEDWNVGALVTQTGGGRGVDDQTLSAGRLTYNAFDGAEAGLIATHGNPDGTSENTVVGFDFRYDTTELFGDVNAKGTAYVIESFDEDERSEGTAWGAALEFPNDRIDSEVRLRSVGETFDPALGFVRRRGVRQAYADFYVQPRPNTDLLRQLSFGASAAADTDFAGELQTSSVDVRLARIELQTEDRIEWRVERETDRLLRPFEISDGVVLQPGEYRWVSQRVRISTSDHRPLELSGGVRWGEFWTGERVGLSAELAWRPNALLDLEAEYEENVIDLPEGEFTTRLARTRTRFAFGPDVSWTTLVQWDDDSDLISVNSRLRWILEPGSDLFLVYNQNFGATRFGLRGSDYEVSFKITYVFRF